jgi:Domain of unknown function (DUF5047)
MQSISDEFRSTLIKSHTIVTKVEVLSGGTTTNVDCINTGSVTIDRTSQVRRRASITMIDEKNNWTPKDARDLLSPYGNYLRIWRGIYLPSGTTEMKCLATVRISKSHVEESDSGLAIQVDGYDRSRYISRNRFAKPYVIAKGTNYGDAIKALLLDRSPTLTNSMLIFDDVGYSTPLLVFEEQADPFAMAVKMAGSCGKDLYVDPMGNIVMKNVPSMSDPVAWEFIEGETCTMTELGRDLDDEGGYNGVIEDSTSSSDVSFRGEAWDSNPMSPTYYLGAYEPCPLFHSSQLFTSNDQCTQAAKARLAGFVGLTQAAQFSAIPNPAQLAGDIVMVDRSVVGFVSELHIIDTLDIPLSADEQMSIQSRIATEVISE